MAQTKTFMVRGTSNYSSEHSIELELKVNSSKQAQERFLKKYESILAGYCSYSEYLTRQPKVFIKGEIYPLYS